MFPRYRPTSWPRFDVWGFVTVAGMQALAAGLVLAPAAVMLILVSPVTQKLFATN